MSYNFSIEHTTVTINGHVCEGWADDGEAIAFPEIDLIEDSVGPDGLLVVSSTGERGGEMMFKFQANSVSVAFFGVQLTRALRGGPVIFSGTIVNNQSGVTTRLEGGVMKNAPMGQSLGKGTPKQQEYTIRFQSILTNYDAMQTQAAPVIAAASGV